MKTFGILVRFADLPNDIGMDDVKRMASDIIMSIPDETPSPEHGKCFEIGVGNVRRVPKDKLQ